MDQAEKLSGKKLKKFFCLTWKTNVRTIFFIKDYTVYVEHTIDGWHYINMHYFLLSYFLQIEPAIFIE